ncbi:hypothetical protein ACSNOG_31615, partial [Streptomyces sp. URMC 124]
PPPPPPPVPGQRGEPAAAEAGASGASDVQCPRCGRVSPGSAKVCSQCRYGLSARPGPAGQHEPPESASAEPSA